MARLTADSRPRNDREANILQVASIIAQNWDGLAPVEEFAATINHGDGWTFDVRYPENQYINANGWTRVEGLTLNEVDLGAAVALATNMIRQDYGAVISIS